MKIQDILFLSFIALVTALGIAGATMVAVDIFDGCFDFESYGFFGICCIACTVVSIIFWVLLFMVTTYQRCRKRRMEEASKGIIDHFSEKSQQ